MCEIERDTEKQKGMLREGERERTERQRKGEGQRNRKTERETETEAEKGSACAKILKLFRQKTIPTYYHS